MGTCHWSLVERNWFQFCYDISSPFFIRSVKCRIWIRFCSFSFRYCNKDKRVARLNRINCLLLLVLLPLLLLLCYPFLRLHKKTWCLSAKHWTLWYLAVLKFNALASSLKLWLGEDGRYLLVVDFQWLGKLLQGTSGLVFYYISMILIWQLLL